MRKIKFRGYNERLKQWVYGFVKYGHNGKYSHWCIQETELNNDRDIWWYEQLEVVEASIGQYTGFKDRNGKEIYEGDIVIDNFGLRQVVEYNEELGLWETYEIDDKTDRMDLYRYCSMCEVIGNVYEEKLKEK